MRDTATASASPASTGGAYVRASTLWGQGLLWLVVLGIVGAPDLAASQPRAGDEPAAPPLLVSIGAEQAPVMDGAVLGDPAWSGAEPTGTFWQTRPDEGQPASERTEVRVIFTDTTLYLGVICYDDEAGALTIADSRRDGSLGRLRIPFPYWARKFVALWSRIPARGFSAGLQG